MDEELKIYKISWYLFINEKKQRIIQHAGFTYRIIDKRTKQNEINYDEII